MKYQIPDENAPGFLRRQKKVQAFLEAEGQDKTQRMIEWLSEYIIGEDKEGILLEASEAEINELMKAINKEVPDPKAQDNSDGG